MNLQIMNVTKEFKDKKAVDKVNLTLTPGVWGLLGANGAGKTTMMKMILGFLKPDSGVIKVCGEEVKFGETKTNKFIGYKKTRKIISRDFRFLASRIWMF